MAEEELAFANFQSSVRIVDAPLVQKNVSGVRSSLGGNIVKSASMTKSASKLEEKFKKYVSEADLLFRKLSMASDTEPAPVDMCNSANLLDRNTESFRCLAQLLLSNSSLMKNRLFLFPPLEDPGISVAFNFKEPVLENDDVGIEKYKKMCKELEIVPISRIINSLETDTLDLKYYGFTNKQIKALTEAMKANARIQNLILQDNWLNLEMTQMVSDMIVENTSLQFLCLQECRIGEEGAQKLGEVMSSLQSLKSLDLSFNDLRDNGLLALQEGLANNISLKKLNLGHNNLTEDSAEIMEKILLENRNLEELDLSWNGFYTAQGNRKLFNGIMYSDRIKILNLSWNGIGILAAVRPLTRYIKKSENLEEIDLSNNRLVGPSLRAIRAAINKNHSLQVVKIGNNIYTSDDAHVLLTVLAGKPKDPLHHLDMENMYINKESKPVLNKIRNMGRTVKIGGILSDYEIQGPNPRKLIYKRCRYILQKPKKAKARKDFGHFILLLPETPLTPEEFQKELKKQKIKKLDKDLVQGLMHLFMNKKKQIECSELVKDYMSFYPETQLPPPKPKKSKKAKHGKKGKDKVEEEKVLEVHDLDMPLDTQCLETEEGQLIEKKQSTDRMRQSKVSLKISQSQKSIRREPESKSNTNISERKSVSIAPKASVMRGRISQEVPEVNVAPKKSIIKTQGSSKGEIIPRHSSKSELARTSSTKVLGSKTAIEGH